MPQVPPASRSKKPTATKLPGRVYTFVTLLLATFVMGLSIVGLKSSPPSSLPTSQGIDGQQDEITAEVAHQQTPGRKPARVISPDELKQLAGIAFGVALLSLVPSRKSTGDSESLTPQLVAHHSGLTVLGSLFGGPATPAARPSKVSNRLLKGVVSLSELVLIGAFTLSLVACLTRPELVSVFRGNPIAGYLEAIRFFTDSAQGWLPAKAPLA